MSSLNTRESSALIQMAEALSSMEHAQCRDSILGALALAAHRMAGCAGVLLHRAGAEECEFFPAADELQPVAPVLPARTGSFAAPPLPALVTEPPQGAKLVGRGDLCVRQVSTVSLAPATGCDSMDFIWDTQVSPDAEVLAVLRSLASAASLALRNRPGADRSSVHYLEYQHRFRNVVSFVRSIVRRTLQSAESPEDFALHLEARIGALSRTQATWIIGTGGIEIEDLVRTELRANAVRDEQFEIGGPSIRLHARAAQTMSLALHELATNSLKYGSLAFHGGHTRIHWQTGLWQGAARLRFCWLESGVRIASSAPRHRGFGQELIENTLPYELDALTRFELTPGGLHCTVDLPLNARTTAEMAAPSAHTLQLLT